ncbi:DUF1328 domain-containing protein [Stenotrophomonas ginsengisoli]|uniref:DUF1328 domain-containing protein n=1 Tax=Stenotrophomonas ginsengisoli TaxID=336566 RepID=UPI000AD0E82B|nr:DUF1328 domain-containing protein [Stenotrophomonas ginsengisoli]
MSRYAVLFLAIAVLAAVAGFAGYAGALGNLIWLGCAVLMLLAVLVAFKGRRG